MRAALPSPCSHHITACMSHKAVSTYSTSHNVFFKSPPITARQQVLHSYPSLDPYLAHCKKSCPAQVSPWLMKRRVDLLHRKAGATGPPSEHGTRAFSVKAREDLHSRRPCSMAERRPLMSCRIWLSAACAPVSRSSVPSLLASAPVNAACNAQHVITIFVEPFHKKEACTGTSLASQCTQGAMPPSGRGAAQFMPGVRRAMILKALGVYRAFS